ncbi:hypothetical protein EW026_g4557 [Hermanssonia centrifuga]|uniref:Transmembrane protein n=1 Tax=Hermanssonia centrifuga TaxID=98765 RepID=A0A4S4KHV6_9APHY|nr:hypothetical protein EW026_g4557 [Hermanssonia centrifuga]
MMLPGLLTGVEQATKTGSKDVSAHSQTASSTSPTSYSIIGSIPPLPTAAPFSSTHTTTAPPPPTITPQPSSTSSSSRGTQEWKIIGVAVISFSVVAAVLLLSVCFDQWWGFIRDLLWKKKRKDDVEELIPDWEKASWEIRVGAEPHRYPSFLAKPSAALNPKVRAQHVWQEKDETHMGNIAGVGSGYVTTNNREETTGPLTQDSALGFLTPMPPALHTDFRDRQGTTSIDRKRDSRAVSQAFSDVDAYGGIAQ